MTEDRRPPWLKVALPGGGRYHDVRRRLSRLEVHTVCEQARCPNAAECWGCGTATFLILGDTCTRDCRFCAVRGGEPAAPDPEEPGRVARAAAELGLTYVVLTSVTRDDLGDGGAAQFGATVEAVLGRLPRARVEVLTPDFGGRAQALARVAASGASVLGHNLETVARLTPRVRDPRCRHERSLEVLGRYRELASEAQRVKSALLLGLGETDEEVHETLAELRGVGVDWVAMGQYLRPTRRHLPVQRYLTPGQFAGLEQRARDLGFSRVTAGPLVRSSYRAGQQDLKPCG